VIPLLILAITGFIQGLGGNKRYGLFYGTFFRSMIPILAGAVLLLNLVSRPILRASEAAYIQADSFLFSSQTGGLLPEMKAAEQLRAEIREVLQKLESMP